MLGLSWMWFWFACAPIFVVHLVSIALTKALQSYSRSRLEERTEALNRPHRADEIAHLDHRTQFLIEQYTGDIAMQAAHIDI